MSTPLPASLAAFEQGQREQNTARRRVLEGPRRHRHDHAQTAPKSADPAVCRWCGRRLKALIAGEPPTFCQAGCASNDIEPYLRQCTECHREFRTGKRHTDVCYECEPKQRAEIASVEEIEASPMARRDEWAERRRAQ